MLIIASLALAAALAAQAAPTRPAPPMPATSGRPVDPAFADVAGVKLGMTPEQVQVALRQAGYVRQSSLFAPNGVTDGESFATLVRKAAVKRQGQDPNAVSGDPVVTSMLAIGPNQERLLVKFAPASAGSSVVSNVELRVAKDRTTIDAFVAQAIGKYGTPDGRTRSTMLWCARPVRSACAMSMSGLAPGRQPYLTVYTYGDYQLSLAEGAEREAVRSREFAAAVDRIAAKAAKAAF